MKDMARALGSSTRQSLPQPRIWCGLSRITWQEFPCGRWTTEGLARFPIPCPTTSVATDCFTGDLPLRFGGLTCRWTSRRWWGTSKETLRISEQKKSWWLCATRPCAASESRWTACRPGSSSGRQWGSGPFRVIGPFSWSKGGCHPWSKRCSHLMRTSTRPRLTIHRFTPLSPRCRKARLCGTSSPEWCITPVTKLPSTPSSSSASFRAASHTKLAEPTTFSTPHRPGKRKWKSCKERGPGGQSPSHSTWSSWCRWATSSLRRTRQSSRQIGFPISRWSMHMIWDPANSSTSTVPTSTTGKPIKRSWNRRRPSLIRTTSSSAEWTCWWRMPSWTSTASKNALSLASCSPFPDEKTSRWRKALPPGRVSRHQDHSWCQVTPLGSSPPWRALMRVDFSAVDEMGPVEETGIVALESSDLSCNSRTSPTTRSRTHLRYVVITRYADFWWRTGIWNAHDVLGRWNPSLMPTSPPKLPAGRRWPKLEECPFPWTRWSSTTQEEEEWQDSQRRDHHLHRPPFEPEAPMGTCGTWHATMCDPSRSAASRTWLTGLSVTHSSSSTRRTRIWSRKPCSSLNGWLAVWVRPLSAPRLRFLEKSWRWPPS